MDLQTCAADGRLDVKARQLPLRGTPAAAPLNKPATPVSASRPTQACSRPAVEISHLRKTYRGLIAVDGVSFAVAEGEIFGILGPNGAGKTTTVECTVGLRAPDTGTIRLLGLDPQADKDEIHKIVGVQLQESSFPAKLRVAEIIEEFRSFYRQPADVTELVEALGLAGKRKDYYRSLSGGQRQRLSVVLALIGAPKIAVLDEMTTGLDPQARRDTWQLIEKLRDRGVTIMLVTHFMEEAERLCDRVALIDAGRLVALDTPAGLTARARGGKRVRFLPSAPFDDRLLAGLPEVTEIERDGRHVVVTGTGELVNAVLFALAASGVTAHGVQLDSSTLEDAFVRLTGKHLTEKGERS
jgi:ABC-2 type transport system ATP-binding protein